MINPDKIDEWIREVEERPSSAELIIRYIANRLSELSKRDEELVAENIELLSGRKVEEYENRIASLEFQLELLKRQLGGEVILPTEIQDAVPTEETLDVFAYNPFGRVLKLEMKPSEMESGKVIGKILGEVSQEGTEPAILVTNAKDELLFLFDSGRTVSHPSAQLPVNSAENFDWQQAFYEEPRIREELAAIIPITKMPLYEICIQASRRGYVKTTKTFSFMAHLKENYIGTGVKLPADKTSGLNFANKVDLFVMVSQEGYIFSMAMEHLPSAIEEVIHLGITDHIVSTFVAKKEPYLLFITRNGKAVHRETSWLEVAKSFKGKGQSILSKERREAGIRIVGAAPIEDADWCAFLSADGSITLNKVKDLLATGSVTTGQALTTILSFSTFHASMTKE